MNRKALEIESAGNARYTELNVGDKVLASYGHGQFVAAYVYAIETEKVFFLWGQIVFSSAMQDACENTVLIEKFNRAALIAELTEKLAGKVA